jgi:diguanylate cyclase (GGDEF)-like protein
VIALRRHLNQAQWALLALAVLGLAVHAAWVAGVGKGSIDTLVNEWVYNAVLVLASVVCLLKVAISPGERWIWLCFGLGLGAWTAADIYWTAALIDDGNPPYPSLADFGYLLVYPFMYVGVLLLVRRRVRFSTSAWLDGAIGGLAAAAFATAILSPALLGLTMGERAVVATNLAYPLGDVLLLAFLIAGVVITGPRAGWSWLLIGAGIATWAVADGIYLYQQATSTYVGGYLDSLWLVGGLAIAGAAALPSRAAVRERHESHSVFFPALFSAIAIGVLAWDHYDTRGDLSIWFAAATLAAVVVRLMLSLRENRALLRAVRREAVTDALTGLDNRRSLMTALDRVADRGDEVVLASFDLDGFKAYNDTFGHPAGDLLLRRMGARLAGVVAPEGRAFRLGGDEFCVLMPGGAQRAESVVALARTALTERGQGFDIGASAGAVVIPTEAPDPTAALSDADRRMYAAKGQRSSSVQRQTHDVLMRALREREPELGDHLRGVASLAAEIGRAAGLDAEDLDVLIRAAELHDIGKLAVPDRILHKPGPLDSDEWDLMRTHTLIGERILSAAPAMTQVAALVRSSHERWDGGGYPDGLGGDEIPLGSRIVFVCDAFVAMTERRPYRIALDRSAAITELHRCAGTQFDPWLVDLFTARVVPRLGELHEEPTDAMRPAPDSAAGGPAAVREVVDSWPVLENRIV